MTLRQHKILVVEDDPSIREGLIEILTEDGHAVVAAEDGREALRHFSESSFDLVLLDLMLPVINGYDVCRQLREQNKHISIIMLSAKGEEIDKVLGLELGADDYVTKPFGVRELLARVHTAFRRLDREPSPAPQNADDEGSFSFGSALIDRKRYVVRREREEHSLSARELHLLEYLHARPGEVLSRDQLLNAVWGIEYYGTTRTLDQHIAQIRKKVAGENGQHLIRTVHGVGYKFSP